MKKGFTMLELLAVMAILAILSTGGYVFVQSSITNANKVACNRQVELVASAEKRFYATQDRHSAEFISGEIINNNSELVTKGYVEWVLDEGFGISVTVDSENPRVFKVSCEKYPDIFVLLDESEFRRDLFVLYPTGQNDGDEDDIDLSDPEPEENVITEDVFVYGTYFGFAGSNVSGEGATVYVKGSLVTSDLNGNAQMNVSNIFIDGFVDLDGGSASLGSALNPGEIIVSSDVRLWSGKRSIYGDFYINGNFSLKDANIYGNVYVNGDLELGNTPTIDPSVKIYYTGSLTTPDNYNNRYQTNVVDRTEWVESVPTKSVPEIQMPSLRDSAWYSNNGYDISNNNPQLLSNMRLYAEQYTSTNWRPDTEDVVIVASDGDIRITGLGGSKLTGILYAPNGKVIFGGGAFEGLVISRDGFDVTTGGTTVLFRPATDFVPESLFPFIP
jgi:prepilin-type N-terminal cleavage/methylation domain-containing protein